MMYIRLGVGLAMLLSVGCGAGTSKVSGIVTVDGKRLSSGTVMIQDSTGEVRLANVEDGTFSLDGIPRGQAKVAVVPGVTGPESTGPSRKHGQFGRGRAQHETPVAVVPVKWQRTETSPQTLQVDQPVVSVEVAVPGG